MAGEQGRDETDIPSDVKARFSDTTANLKKGAEELGSKAKKSAQTVPSDVKARLGDTTANLKKGAEELGSKAKKSAQTANDAIKDKFQEVKEQAKNWSGEYNESNEIKERDGERNGEREAWNGETKKEEVKQNGIDENGEAEVSKEELDPDVETSEPEEIESNNLDGDEKAYEVNPDEVLNTAEKKAEEEMQPNGGA